MSSLQKYVVFHGYSRDSYLVVIRISPIFPIFPSTVTFSHDQNPLLLRHYYGCLAFMTVVSGGKIRLVLSSPCILFVASDIALSMK